MCQCYYDVTTTCRSVLNAVDRNGLHWRTKEFLNIHDAMRMALSLHTESTAKNYQPTVRRLCYHGDALPVLTGQLALEEKEALPCENGKLPAKRDRPYQHILSLI
ncbi:hypothetical protein QQF64_030385 [Cirrhinus molitorella]|uniref:Uncharacterized protein n=1 Tax=Cirrhinus molitorella TaxID=172907 RepID=A0ABR3N389_9TELE